MEPIRQCSSLPGGLTAKAAAVGGTAGGPRQWACFRLTAGGLHELYGNAWEWVQDCYTPGYSSAPRDGTAWELAGCSERVRRGGSWNTRPERLRAALRNKAEANFRSSRVGFRVAQTLNPSSIPDSERQVTSGFSRARQTESSGGSVTPDTEYRLTFRASPVYPQMAEREDIEGYAVVQFTVTALGYSTQSHCG